MIRRIAQFQPAEWFKIALGIEIAVVMAITTYFLPGGEDLYSFYLPLAEGCLDCAFNPWYTSWLLFPLTLIPLRILWPLWVLLTGLGLFWASRRLGTESAFVLLSFPAMGLVWLGQVDVLVAVGLMLALVSRRPAIRGVGLLLASVKPQIAAVPILILLWHDEARWKTLIIPGAVVAASLVVWGIDWPLRWMLAGNPIWTKPVWGLASLYPYGLVALLSILLFKKPRDRVTAALLGSALGMPGVGVYSHASFLPFIAPWWALPLSYLWFVGYPWLEARAMQFAWILPLSLLVFLMWPALRERWPGIFGRLPAIRRENGETAEESSRSD